MSDTRLMTYADFAEAIGRSLPAARAMCIRKNWRRIVGNDGKALVAVPVEMLERPRKSDTQPDEQPEALPDTVPDDVPEGDAEDLSEALSVVALLRGQIGRLEADLERATSGLDEVRATLEIERVRAAQVEVLQTLLEAERRHVDAERQHWTNEREHLNAAQDEARQRADELREDRDRWFGELQAERAKRGRWWPFRRRA